MENNVLFDAPEEEISEPDGKLLLELTPELYDNCLEYLRQRKCSEKTRLLYTKELDNIFKSKTLTQTLYNRVYSKGNYYKSVLRLILEVCNYFEIPFPKYKVITPIKKRRPNPQVWRETDILRMASNIEYHGLLIECAYYIGAGLRFSSAIFIKWEDFHWEDWLQDKAKTGKCDILAKGSKEKPLLVDPILMNKLYKIAIDKGKVFQGIPYKNSSEDTYFFIRENDLKEIEAGYRKENFQSVLDSNKEQINVRDRARLEIIRKKHYLVDYQLRKISGLFNGKRIKFHSIRHSRATHLLKRGFKLLTIKEQLMHNSIATTEIYLNLENRDVEDEFNEKLNFQ